MSWTEEALRLSRSDDSRFEGFLDFYFCSSLLSADPMNKLKFLDFILPSLLGDVIAWTGLVDFDLSLPVSLLAAFCCYYLSFSCSLRWRLRL